MWTLLSFPNLLIVECGIFTASSFWIWTSSTGIPSLPLALFIVMLPKSHLTSHSRRTGSRWVITPSWLSGYWRSFFVEFICVFFPPLLNIFCFSYHFCPLLSPIIAWNVPLVSLIFLKRSLVFFILFSSMSLHWSLRQAFLSLLSILWNFAFKWVYISLYPLALPSLLFSAISKNSSDNHFACLHFFFLRIILNTASWSISCTSIHSSSSILCIRSNPLNLFVTFTV